MDGEFELIEKIKALSSGSEGVTVGIGDDAAVLDPGRFDLVTTDTLVEGVHFDLSYFTPFDVGWKAVAVSLSDIAAMGGGPGVLFLNLAIPRGSNEALLDGLLDGMSQALKELVPRSFQVCIGGGDTTSTRSDLVVTTTLLGESSPAGPQLRSGAVPGDRVVVLGPLGLSAAGLDLLSRGDRDAIESFPALSAAHLRPRPRVYEGGVLGLYGIPSAMLDVSDGFLQDLSHILSASGVGASIESHGLPRHEELERYAQRRGVPELDWILSGGEDFELLFTVPPSRMPKLWELARRYEWDVFDVGEIRARAEGLRLLGSGGEVMKLPERLGYTHRFEEEE